VVATSDPQYPTAALRGSLPALVAHLSEHKLAALRAVLLSDALATRACVYAHLATMMLIYLLCPLFSTCRED
jgi:hypothetical protein